MELLSRRTQSACHTHAFKEEYSQFGERFPTGRGDSTSETEKATPRPRFKQRTWGTLRADLIRPSVDIRERKRERSGPVDLKLTMRGAQKWELDFGAAGLFEGVRELQDARFAKGWAEDL